MIIEIDKGVFSEEEFNKLKNNDFEGIKLNKIVTRIDKPQVETKETVGFLLAKDFLELILLNIDALLLLLKLIKLYLDKNHKKIVKIKMEQHNYIINIDNIDYYSVKIKEDFEKSKK